MIRDGLDRPRLLQCSTPCGACSRACRTALQDEQARQGGWQPISTAPIARLDVVIRRGRKTTFVTSPRTIEGLTTHGNIVPARYFADGNYRDCWTNERGNVRYALTHWRPLRKPR